MPEASAAGEMVCARTTPMGARVLAAACAAHVRDAAHVHATHVHATPHTAHVHPTHVHATAHVHAAHPTHVASAEREGRTGQGKGRADRHGAGQERMSYHQVLARLEFVAGQTVITSEKLHGAAGSRLRSGARSGPAHRPDCNDPKRLA